MPVDMKAKYLSLPASSPWSSIPGTRFVQTQLADIDGDGRDEVVAFTPDPTGLLTGSMGMLSYFAYAGLSSQWNDAPPNGAQQLVATTLVPANLGVPNQVWQASIRGGGVIDVIGLSNNQWLTLWRWQGANEQTGEQSGLVAYWSTFATVYGLNGEPNWPLSASDTFAIGDIDGDGLAEIVVFDGNSNLAVLKWNGSDIRVHWAGSGGAVPASTINRLGASVRAIASISAISTATVVRKSWFSTAMRSSA